MVSADVSQQQLTVRTRVLTLLAWKCLSGVVTASVQVQTLLLDTKTEKTTGQLGSVQEVHVVMAAVSRNPLSGHSQSQQRHTR